MIRDMDGSIFDSRAQALVVPVNCVGAAGKGLALEFKKKFPGWYEDYREVCRDRDLRFGRLHVWVKLSARTPFIISLPTKGHWSGASELPNVRAGLEELARQIDDHTSCLSILRSIAVPALGCGLGGLAWSDVRPLIERTLGSVPELVVMVYPPGETR